MTELLYLASSSPRRAELLMQIGVRFARCAVAVDETPNLGEAPAHYVERLARDKAQAGWRQLQPAQPKACVLGADTAVVIDGNILGKPRDAAAAMAMLQQLSGREHQVLSAVALLRGQQCQSLVVESRVRFRTLSMEAIRAYWACGESADKAGAYGIQGRAAVWVEEIQGSYSGVVGLPLCETAQLLERFGISYWNRSASADQNSPG